MALMLLGLLGCWPALPPCPRCVDNDDVDGDGFSPAQGDCDDGSLDVRPGAVERCNGIDDDCDGLVDVGAIDAQPLWVDADQDGYGTGSPEVGCALGDPRALVGGDCDDAAADVNPGAVEVCNDGVDNDCDASPDPCVRDGARSLAEADALIASTSQGASLGEAIAAGPDGILVGAPDFGVANGGVVYRFAPRAEWTDLAADEGAAAVLRTTGSPGFGRSLARHGADWVVRANPLLDTRGLVHVLSGSVSGESDPAAVALATRTGGLGDAIGRLVAAGDDGVLVTSDAATDAAWWLPAPLSGELPASSGGIRIGGEDLDALAVGDLDGDGIDDLVVGRGQVADGVLVAAGAVYVFFGPLAADTTLDDADAVLTGTAINARAGSSLAVLPDLDGDQVGELAVAGPDGTSGVVWIVPGPPTSGDLDRAAWLILEGLPLVDVGRSIVALDLDVDGHLDLAVGAPREDEPAPDAGVVFVERGPFAEGRRHLDDAALVLLGEGDDHRAGTSLAAADVDGDGVEDLIIGAPRNSTRAEDGGGVYVWLGRGL